MLICASLFNLTVAQPRRRARASTRLIISVAKIENDLVGQTLYEVPDGDGRPGGNWRFLADEYKRVKVLESSARANRATVVIQIVTGDANSRIDGKLRLHYERIAGEWILRNIENLTVKRTAGGVAYEQPRQVHQDSPRQEAYPPQRTTKTFKIVNSQFHVPAGAYVSHSILIPQSAGTGYVVGRFQATSGNNIQVHIVDSDGLINFQNRSQFRSYYSSARVTVGTINVQLAAGQYYLLFENYYSVFSNKIVWADVSLVYED
jgi:hypothetical protein